MCVKVHFVVQREERADLQCEISVPSMCVCLHLCAEVHFMVQRKGRAGWRSSASAG